MKLIIDIDKDYFEILKYEARNGNDFRPIKIIANGTPLEEELKKMIDKIDFQEKWLTDIKMDNGFISVADIHISMNEIKSVVKELKGEDK